MRTIEVQIDGSPTSAFEPGETNPISDLVNYNLDESVGPGIFVPQNMTLGAGNEGISFNSSN